MSWVSLIISVFVAAVIGLTDYFGRRAYAVMFARTRSPGVGAAIRLTAAALLFAETILVFLVADWLVLVMFGIENLWEV